MKPLQLDGELSYDELIAILEQTIEDAKKETTNK